jgi:hypothetical protein
MADDGGISRVGDEIGVRLNRHSLQQLCGRGDLPVGAAPYLAACPPSLRATNVNAWLPFADGNALVRTRSGSMGEREIFGLTSTRYRPFDADRIAAVLASTASAGARGEVAYDGSRFRITAHYHSDIRPESCVAGEIFRAAIIVETADDGSHGVRVGAAVTRNLCRNLIVLGSSEQSATARHTNRDLEATVGEMIATAMAKVSTFAEAWSAATRDRIIDADRFQPAELFGRLVDHGLVHVAGYSRDEMVGRLLSAWHVEPGYSRAAVVNAVTRVAHESSWSSMWAASDLEEQAGQLLYQHVVLA